MIIDHFNRATRIIIAAAVAVVIWIAGVLIGQEQTVTILNPEGGLSGLITRTRSIQVSLMLDYGDGRIKVIPEIKLTYGAAVTSLLKRWQSIEPQFSLSYQTNKETGKISGLTINNYASSGSGSPRGAGGARLDARQEAGKEWLVWLNHTLQTSTIDKIRLKNGDLVELKYIKLKE